MMNGTKVDAYVVDVDLKISVSAITKLRMAEMTVLERDRFSEDLSKILNEILTDEQVISLVNRARTTKSPKDKDTGWDVK